MPRAPHAPDEGLQEDGPPTDPTYADMQPVAIEGAWLAYAPLETPDSAPGWTQSAEAQGGTIEPTKIPAESRTGLRWPSETSNFTISTRGMSAATRTEAQHKRNAEIERLQAALQEEARRGDELLVQRDQERVNKHLRRRKPEYVERDGFDISDKVVWGTFASFVTAGFLGFVESTYGLPAPEGADVFLSGAVVAIAGSVVAYFKRERV